MQINKVNIFEAMRLVLPEHRGSMAIWQRQRSVRTQPILLEDELESMQFILSDAIKHHCQVRLTLFGEYEKTMLAGVLVMGWRLQIANDKGIFTVDIND